MPDKPGYDDTPVLAGSGYRVHDKERPQPRIVWPGNHYGEPPGDAVVLFDGSSLAGWESVKGGPAHWKLEHGYMEAEGGAGDIQTALQFGDAQIHVEWAAPADVRGESQGRGNSGVFLMGRYEIQVLDCYDNPTYADGTTAAIYGQYPPLVNACRRPGEFQAYDIIWEAPRFEGERVARPARLTLLFNGVLAHHAQELQGGTRHRALPEYEAHASEGPLRLQDHGNPVRFRNIWYRPL